MRPGNVMVLVVCALGVFATRRYQVTAHNLELLLWYSLNDRWLALESKTRSGKILRYDLL